MANNYREFVAGLLSDEKISQEEHDQLVDLNAAKDALKEFNSVKTERDELAAFKARIETAPKRREALQRVGVDYDALPKYGQKALDSIPGDKLDDLNFVAQFVKEEGFEATLSPEEQTHERSGAEEMTAQMTSMGTGAPPSRTSQAAKQQAYLDDLDKIPDGDKNAINEVLAKHGMLPATEG